MPWSIRKAGKKWEVYNEETGETVSGGEHSSEEKAKAHVRALYANVDEARKVESEQGAIEKFDEAIGYDKDLFIPIAKIDQRKRQVWGWGAMEVPDSSDEIMDYVTSKPYWMRWSEAAQKRSGGRSLGNLRSMHKGIAAGKLINFQADDAQKGFWVGAEVVDDDEWRKVEAGVYTGFSVGGRYVKRWVDPKMGKMRYTAEPAELSLVDAPCIPTATFQVIKMDGAEETRSFAPTNGKNVLKAEIPESPEPLINADEATVQQMPGGDIVILVSPTEPPDGETLASLHPGVVELTEPAQEIAASTEDVAKAGQEGDLNKAGPEDKPESKPEKPDSEAEPEEETEDVVEFQEAEPEKDTEGERESVKKFIPVETPRCVLLVRRRIGGRRNGGRYAQIYSSLRFYTRPSQISRVIT